MLNLTSSPDLGELWAKFIAANNKPELKEWQRKVYVKGQHQPMNEKWVEEKVEKQLKEKEGV